MRCLVALALLLLAACAEATGAEAPGACGLVGQSVLPISRVGPFVSVDSRVDGTPARLMVDSGAQATVLSAAAARRAGAVLDLHRVVRATGIGGTATYPTARIGRLLLGNIPVEPAVVAVMPTVPVVDGNIGMDILGDVDLDFNLPAGRITLHRGWLCPGTGPPWATGATELRTQARQSRLLPPTARPLQLLLVMALDGVPALAMVDSGAGRTLVSRSFVARLGVTDAALAARPPLRLSGLSPLGAEGRWWQFHEARIGTERLNAPVMVVADLHDQGFDLLLGMDYLATHRVWLSYGTRRIFVAPP